MNEKCNHGLSISILGPTGEPVEVDPCDYIFQEAYKNVSVCVSRCTRCGHISISWHKQPDTEEIDADEFDTF